ncbi:hypothetical protein E4U42_003005 [Claviceps africana]|uniref:RING-type domain-containing protein n=1 Tax=Claviceps africana TaxID=83212 RepID=A0A8K0JA69_9HYPO|nr:hypothetical protein E4U42_003005 [Claviceps africana]
MDGMDLPPNTSRSLPANSDYFMQAPSDRWTLSHPSPLSQWHSQPLPRESVYFAHGHNSVRALPDSTQAQPAQTRQHNALPHPDRSLRALQNPEFVAGPPTAPTWTFGPHPTSGMAHHASEASYVMNMAPMSSGSPALVDEPAHANSGVRGLALESQSAAVWEASGAMSASLSTATRLFPGSGRPPGNVSDSFSAPSSSTMLPHSPNPISPLRSTQIPSPSSQMTPRPQASATISEYRDISGLTSSTPDRRRHASGRARRPTGSRQPESGLFGIHDEAEADQSSRGKSQTPASRVYQRASLSDEMLTRHMSVFRGLLTRRLVASAAAIQSLERLETCSLAENEKTCVICYNDYGVASPEGVIEAAVRLPLCKHIFGDHCIKKWLEDSDSCPYCRRKLPPPVKYLQASTRTFFNMMRLRGIPLPAGLSDDVLLRIATTPITEVEFDDLITRAARPAERRPPPDDSITQEQRRTRQRRIGPGSEHDFLEEEYRGPAHTRSTTSDAPSRQLPISYRDFVPAEGSWPAQLTVPGSAPTRAPQAHGQPRLATGEGSVQPNTSGADRRQTTSARLDTRPDTPMAPVVVNGSSLRGNPLLTHLGHGSSPSPASYYPSILPPMNDPTQPPADSESSPFHLNRIRPW